MNYKKNDVLTVEIEDIGHDGAGIGKVDGYTLFVKDAVIGDVVEVKVMKAKKKLRIRKAFEDYYTICQPRGTPLPLREAMRRLSDSDDVLRRTASF